MYRRVKAFFNSINDAKAAVAALDRAKIIAIDKRFIPLPPSNGDMEIAALYPYAGGIRGVTYTSSGAGFFPNGRERVCLEVTVKQGDVSRTRAILKQC